MNQLDGDIELLRSRPLPLPRRTATTGEAELGAMAFQRQIDPIADIAAQAVAGTYDQAALQASFNAVTGKLNELIAAMRAAEHIAG